MYSTYSSDHLENSPIYTELIIRDLCIMVYMCILVFASISGTYF